MDLYIGDYNSKKIATVCNVVSAIKIKNFKFKQWSCLVCKLNNQLQIISNVIIHIVNMYDIDDNITQHTVWKEAWAEETLANDHKFAKFKPSKFFFSQLANFLFY